LHQPLVTTEEQTMMTFPFGAPVHRLAIDPPGRQVDAVVIGAYPSAFHVSWRAPDGRRVAALPVDNEPVPFWDGSGADELFEQWRSQYFTPQWGSVRPSAMNGSSGRKLFGDWIAPLGVGPDDYFVTDCLDTAMMSTGVQRRVTAAGGESATYHQLIGVLGLPPAEMPHHPSEGDIVAQARGNHDRLRGQLAASGATTLITLGNAAARVVAELGGQAGGALERDAYQEVRSIDLGGHSYAWHALVHPAVRPPWTEIHRAWLEARRTTAPG
jgi:hypothetical protein